MSEINTSLVVYTNRRQRLLMVTPNNGVMGADIKSEDVSVHFNVMSRRGNEVGVIEIHPTLDEIIRYLSDLNRGREFHQWLLRDREYPTDRSKPAA